jgi:hypothetical protein
VEETKEEEVVEEVRVEVRAEAKTEEVEAVRVEVEVKATQVVVRVPQATQSVVIDRITHLVMGGRDDEDCDASRVQVSKSARSQAQATAHRSRG